MIKIGYRKRKGKFLNKAFTLIELLAVIIILAIIALIATPIILNVIADARISAGRSEANMILGGINNYCASEDMKYQLDNSYERICTSSMDAEDVKEMVNLGNATIESIKYNGSKLTELVIESNNHKFTLCPSGTFAMDDEECDEIVITTGPIKEVVLSNFPYLETNGNGCVTPTDNNYSYMGGCYIKGNNTPSGENIFYLMMNEMGLDNDTTTQTFFDSEGNFVEENFENWFKDFAIQQSGMTKEEINQMLQEVGVSTFFEYFTVMLSGRPMTPEELFAKEEVIINNSLWYSGFLWRIMGINADGTVRLITDENVTSIPWGAKDTAKNWDGSYAKDWLNNYFYPRLKGNTIIVSQSLCIESYDHDSIDSYGDYGYAANRTTCSSDSFTEPIKVGMISLDEYNLAGGSGSYLNMWQDQWTMTPSSSSLAWYVNAGGGTSNNYVSGANGLRPVINVNSNVTITGGDGTLETYWNSEEGPYILNEDKSLEITGKLTESATSGEYVMYAGKKYRVVDKDSNGNTKLILDGYYEENENIFEMKYNEESTNVFSTTTGVGQKLNEDVLNWLVPTEDIENRNKLVTDYTWYQNNFFSGYDYKIALNENSPTRSINATVGLIRVGEMLSGQSSSILTKGYTINSSFENYENATTYWTITPETISLAAYGVFNYGYSSGINVSIAHGLRPVIVIKSDVNIISGNGTWSNPYQI